MTKRRRKGMLCLLVLTPVLGHAVIATGQEVPDDSQTAVQLFDTFVGRVDRPKPVEADRNSPLAAGRYFDLLCRMPADACRHCGMLESRVDRFAVIQASEVTAEQYAKELEDAQPWIEEFIRAGMMERGDIRLNGSFRDRALEANDPRRNLLGNLRKADRLLRDDAVRLWVGGRHDQALRRLAACLGMARHLSEEQYNDFVPLVAQNEIDHVSEMVRKMSEADGAKGVRSEELRAAVGALDPADPTRIRANWKAGAEARLAFAEAESKGDHLSDRLIGELAAAKVAGEAFSRLFDSLINNKDGKPALDAPGLLRRLQQELGDVKAQDARGTLVRARLEIQRIDREWTHPEADLAIPKDPMDHAGIMEYVLGVPGVCRKYWSEEREQVRMLRRAVGLPVADE